MSDRNIGIGAAGRLRLGINIDHVATVRNARGGRMPDPLRAARIAAEAGADGITAHLREDRRHIVDDDIMRLRAEIGLPLNLEMAPTEAMTRFAVSVRPHAACLVPEKREERTTEGGLDVAGAIDRLRETVAALSAAGIRVSMFIEPDRRQLDASRKIGAPVVELHTGTYCEHHLAGDAAARAAELDRIADAARHGAAIGLEVHAGHGLDYDSVGDVAALPELAELNIGHFLIGEAIFVGLAQSIRGMRARMDAARGGSVAATEARR